MALKSFVTGFLSGVWTERNKDGIKDYVKGLASSPEAKEIGKAALIKGGKIVLTAAKALKGG